MKVKSKAWDKFLGFLHIQSENLGAIEFGLFTDQTGILARHICLGWGSEKNLMVLDVYKVVVIEGIFDLL